MSGVDMPWRMLASVAAAVATLATAAPRAEARRVDPDDSDAQDRLEHDRDERTTIRDMVRGWTWAAMPPVEFNDGGQFVDDDHPRRRLLRLTALAATASGDAIVGGAVRGPMRLGATSIGVTPNPRGFVARIDRGGRFRMIRFAEAEPWMVPSALAVERAGRIVVSYEGGKLAAMTPEGRVSWTRVLLPARALAFASNGDILAAGCRITKTRLVGQKSTGFYDKIEDGYFARISRAGDIVWTYRLDRGQQDLFYRPNGRPVTDCATAIAPAPDGDIYVAGHFVQAARWDLPEEEPGPTYGIFLARISGGGRLRWSRLVAQGTGRVALAAAPNGDLVVVAGHVATLNTPGIAAFDADGMPVWSLPITSTPTPPSINLEIENLQIVAHKHGKADFACVGTYRFPIEVGDARLAETEGGVFLAEVNRRGAVTALRGIPGTSRPKGAGTETSNVSIGPGPSGLWVGGTMRVQTTGAWIQAVPW